MPKSHRKDDRFLYNSEIVLKSDKILIAGPCSAESESQVLACAAAVKGLGADFFRAGLWKPRTRPGCFEGLGEQAIPWLAKASETYGIPVVTEVAGAAHVRQCLDAGIKAFWIGARTTTNPFLVQEIADSLSGTDAKVFIKNPVSPDENLWIGAVERLRKAGIDDIALIHRGFASLNSGRYRNAPLWPMLLQIKDRLPGLPIICDPSHIAGDAAFVPELAQRAMDLGLDGLMIECHPDPSQALSDSTQQLTPEELKILLDKLVIRTEDTTDEAFNENLSELRADIDALDAALVDSLSKRMEISRKIGELKKATNISIVQPGRWDNVLASVANLAQEQGLDPDFVRRLFSLIHEESIKQQ